MMAQAVVVFLSTADQAATVAQDIRATAAVLAADRVVAPAVAVDVGAVSS